MRHAGKTKPGVSRASGYCMERRTLVLDVQLGAAVARTAFRIVRTVVVGVRRDRAALAVTHRAHQATRSEEHTSELQSLMRISYAVFCLKKKKKHKKIQQIQTTNQLIQTIT